MHTISYIRMPNGTDLTVMCSCGFSALALSKADALRVAKTHIYSVANPNPDRRKTPR